MEGLVFVVIMVAALAVAALVIGRAQQRPSPDNPTRPEPGERTVSAEDPRDRPAGPGAELDAPHTSELAPGEATDPSAGADDVGRASGGIGNEERDAGGREGGG
ncbi:MAG TPA: hypothetical protein VM324_10325 [Egibacteraceae bacterium]|jgi:hypothetical protein|nr:hypothetical protein [Egibacteraceae bacterium]